MANKRNLKHTIHLVCEELFSECVAASLYGAQGHKDNAEALLYSIVRMQEDFVCRVSHPEPGIKARDYYKDIREKFAAQVSELADQINAL